MDNAIVDMVLGLVLLYLLLAILATKVQEIWDGQWRGGRPLTMHRLLLEAVGRNETLKKQILENPAVFALYQGEAPAEVRTGMSSVLSAATGPSKIPADLFARTLLVELYADGKGSHPSSRFSTPQAFMADKAPVGKPIDDSTRIWATLRTLLAGRETRWADFENAIAQWFSDIGDRSDGWFQRRSAKFAFMIAVLLAVGLNADTIHVADRLARDADLRGSLSTLAQRVNALFPGGQEAPKEAAQAALKEIAPQEAPLSRASRLLKDSIARIGRVFWRDDDVARTQFDQLQLAGANKPALAQQELVMNCARYAAPPAKPVEECKGKPGADCKPKADASKEFLSNPGTWVRVLPAMLNTLHVLDTPPDPPEAPPTLRSRSQAATPRGATPGELQACLSLLSGQVRTVAAMRSDTPAGADLVAAADAMDEAREAVKLHAGGQDVRLPMARLFQRDPELFAECVKGNPPTQEILRRCLDAGIQGRVRLPIFHSAENWRVQFCRPRTLADVDTPYVPIFSASCAEQVVERNERLGFSKGLKLVGPDWGTVFQWLFGCLLTAFFVALGSPFWFDVLSRVSKVRAAGEVRKHEPKADAGDGPGGIGSDTPKPGPDPFSLARNLFERALTPADITALQRALGVAATGVLDGPTRTAIAARAKVEGLNTGEELSLILYERVVGRSASAAIVPRSDGSLVLREPHPLAPTMATQLCRLLHFDRAQRFPVPANTPDPLKLPTSFTDELRSLAVLYRYKSQPAVERHLRTVVSLATDNRATLDTLDLALANDMLNESLTPRPAVPAADPFARATAAPWLDWALGELGQIEKNEKDAAKSNPRILEYLEKAGITGTGDSTAWCAAFVSWVIDKARVDPLIVPAPAFNPLPPSPAKAAGWIGWGASEQTFDTAAPGDIVCLLLDTANPPPPPLPDEPKPPNPGNPKKLNADHMAIVLKVDTGNGIFWAIGGNQGGTGQVKVSCFKRTDAVYWGRPA
ncbi:MAG: hypothetical protein CFE41_08590 [Burkholderiales bacterium PBB2]|nr:MAG: hypothetical protein CFE41_08590 [Burkholderiales bacterium PBB2]